MARFWLLVTMITCSMPAADRLLDPVLDDWLVDQRQHLFRLCLGGGKEACSPTGGRKDGFTDAQSNLRVTGQRVGPV